MKRHAVIAAIMKRTMIRKLQNFLKLLGTLFLKFKKNSPVAKC